MPRVSCSGTKNEFHWTSWQWWVLLNALRGEKLCFCFWLLHWLSNIIAVPMEQTEIPRELLFSYSVDAILTIIMSSIKMVSIASTLWENKRFIGISDCSVGTAIMLDSQWNNQKQKQSFFALRGSIVGQHCSLCMVQFRHGNQQAYGKQNYKNSKHLPDPPAQVVNRSQLLAPSIFFVLEGMQKLN